MAALPTGSSSRKEALLFFTVASGTIVAFWKRQRLLQEKAEREEKEKLLEGVLENDKEKLDDYYLHKAHQFRLQLAHPQQSNFRMCAILLLENANMVYGTNDEPSPNISMSLCAERCAFLRYRAQLKNSPIKTIYIVTDAEKPVPPGTLCREYMYSHPATLPTTRVVAQSKDPESEPSVWTLGELHPYASIYIGMSPQQQMDFGTKHQLKVQTEIEKLELLELTEEHVLQLVRAARSACQLDTKDSVHSIRYGAAAALQSHDAHVHFIQASQVKALEYGCTQDAVCQLASHLLAPSNHNLKVVAVVQVDQFGIPHGPFAQARSFLAEHGFGDVHVILSTMDPVDGHISVKTVAAKTLAPYVPEFRFKDE